MEPMKAFHISFIGYILYDYFQNRINIRICLDAYNYLYEIFEHLKLK